MGSLHGGDELRRLPASARHTLGQMLAVNGGWRSLMGHVRQPGTDLPLFSSQHMQLVTEESVRSGRSETDILLDEWGTWGCRQERPTIDDLVTLLTRLSLFRAADFININVLEVAPMPRPTTGLGASVPHDEEAVRALLSEQATPAQPEPEPDSEPGPEPEPEPGPEPEEPSADIRHFNYGYLEKVTGEFDDRPASEGGCRLGAGAYGTVYLGTCETAERLAVKRLLTNAETVHRQFRTEVEVMSSFRHENLLELLGFSCDGPENCLVYSYMSNGSLLDRLACKGGSAPLSWPRRLHIASGTARGIVHLHTGRQRSLIHRDIKSANVLLDGHLTPKVGDFGLAREVAGGGRTSHTLLTTTVLGTSAYMPPEAFRGDVSVKLDTFSFGIVLLELLTGLPPYDETREGFDLLSHVEDRVDEASLQETLDDRAAEMDASQAASVYRLACTCTEEKRRRPLMVDVLQQLLTL